MIEYFQIKINVMQYFNSFTIDLKYKEMDAKILTGLAINKDKLR